MTTTIFHFTGEKSMLTPIVCHNTERVYAALQEIRDLLTQIVANQTSSVHTVNWKEVDDANVRAEALFKALGWEK